MIKRIECFYFYVTYKFENTLTKIFLLRMFWFEIFNGVQEWCTVSRGNVIFKGKVTKIKKINTVICSFLGNSPASEF